MKAISIGEVLWDIVGETEHLGGATFNFSAHLSRLGHDVSFISAVGMDERGRRILERMADLGLSTRYVRQLKDQTTGVVSVTLAADGQPQFVLHRPAAHDFPLLTESELGELASKPADWIYFGTLLQMSPQAKRLTLKLLDCGCAARKFYDVNLRKDNWEASLVRESLARATVVKLNEEEVREVNQIFGLPIDSLKEFCWAYASRFGWEGVCVTRGARGCVALVGEQYVEAPGYSVTVADAVGAGDAFAAAFLHGLSNAWPPSRIADFANRVGALVASRPGAIPSWTVAEAKALCPPA